MASDSLAHQDWKPVVLTKPKTKEEKLHDGEFTTETRHGAGKNKQKTSDVLARKIDSDDGYKPTTVTPSLAKQIAQARAEKKMSQADLAKACNVKLQVVQQYENINQALPIVESSVLMRMGKVLGKTFHKPKPTKTKS